MRRGAGVLQFRDMLGGARGVVPIMRRQLALADDVAALGQRRRLAVERLDAVQRGASSAPAIW